LDKTIEEIENASTHSSDVMPDGLLQHILAVTSAEILSDKTFKEIKKNTKQQKELASQPHPGNQLSSHTSDDRRDALLKNIIAVTSAEYDWPCHITTALHQILHTLKWDILKDRLTQLASLVKQPEDLVFFEPMEDKSILFARDLPTVIELLALPFSYSTNRYGAA